VIERLVPARSVLLVTDIQERLLAVMPEPVAKQVVKNVTVLIEAAARFGIPIVVSQQYPKGLGLTVPELEAALTAAGSINGGGTQVHRFDKVEFSAVCTSQLVELRGGPLASRDQWIVTGMETHICVYQSVRDLAGANQHVHVVADAVASRTKQNWRIGLDLMRTIGATITSTEVCVFDLLERAGTDHFKALSKAIK
jgi:isochorismate hydrolase